MTNDKDLFSRLLSGEDQTAEAASKNIASQGSRIIPRLRSLCMSANPDHRWWALRTIAMIPSKESQALLIHALHDPDTTVQQCAVLGLMHQPINSAIPALISLLNHPQALTRRIAGDALISHDSEAVPGLMDLAEKTSGVSRSEAIRVLAYIQDHRAIPLFYELLDSDSTITSYWAEQGLDRLGIGMVFFRPE